MIQYSGEMYRYDVQGDRGLRVQLVGVGSVPLTEGLRLDVEKDITRRLAKGGGH